MKDITTAPLLFDYTHATMKNSSQRFNTHCHNAYEIIFFIRGNANYIVEDRKYSLKKYDLIITHPAKFHNMDIRSDDDYERYDILIEHAPQLVGLLGELNLSSDVIDCSLLPIVVDNFGKLDLYSSKLPQDDFFVILNNLLVEICYNLLIHDEVSYQTFDSISPIIQEALHYISENLFTIKNIADISDHLFVAKNYFFKLFKEQMHTSPKRYINAKRLLYAQTMLTNGEKST